MGSPADTLRYDYIFLGGGISTFACLLHMVDEEFFADKKILIIERDAGIIEKNLSFRSPQFPPILEGLSHKSWEYSEVFSHRYDQAGQVSHIPYWSVRASDFITFVSKKLADSAMHITRITDTVVSFEEHSDEEHSDEEHTDTKHSGYTTVTCNSAVYHGTYLFNSIPALTPQKKQPHHFRQCFVGYEVSIDEEIFDPEIATVMEFCDCEWPINFVYTLPTSSTRALVEYTYFTPNNPIGFDRIEDDLKNHLSTLGSYTIHTKEQGHIPMRHHTPRRSSRIIDIGSAGGATKPSSGYTFFNTIRHSQKIVSSLKNHKPIPLPYSSRHRRYDTIMLQVMTTYPEQYHALIVQLFKHTPEHALIRFLNEESTLLDEFDVIKSLPKLQFIKALFIYYFGLGN